MAATKRTKADKATDNLSGLVQSGDKGALDAVNEIVNAFNAFTDAKANAKKIAKESRLREEQEMAAVKNAIEDSLPTNAGAQTVMGKLTTIESSWQEYQDAIAMGIEERKAAKADLKAASKRLDRAVVESAQLALDFTDAVS
jgi:hypothetical protein